MALDANALAQSFQPVATDLPADVHFEVSDFDNLIEEQGMTFVHFRAMPCPVGKSDRYDIRKTHEDHAGCSNGFLYRPAGEVTAVATGNARSKSLIDVGILNGSSMQVTPARYYSNNPTEEVIVAPFDRFYLKDSKAMVVHSQLFESNQSGMDRLQYPAVKVEALIDSNGVSYEQEADFVIEKGQVRWVGMNRPAMDPMSNKGQVCSVRYRYIPYWYVDRILHEIRVVKAYDEKQQAVVTQRMPYAIMLQRENAFEGSERNDEKAPNPDSGRQAVAPRTGSFGPR
jgi:hypothetical protein